MKRLLLLAGLAYGIWSLFKAFRQRQLTQGGETGGYGDVPTPAPLA